MLHNRKIRVPERDNSRNISVRMTEEQYQRLQRYMRLTRLTSTTYFRHLTYGNTFRGHSPELNRAMHASVNKLYSNARQIACHRQTSTMDAQAVRKLLFLADKLCEEVDLLSRQE